MNQAALLAQVARIHGDRPAISYGQRVCRTYAELGDRVATLAWNDYRHLEAYYAISGIGAVCHTINPRLFPDQILAGRMNDFAVDNKNCSQPFIFGYAHADAGSRQAAHLNQVVELNIFQRAGKTCIRVGRWIGR